MKIVPGNRILHHCQRFSASAASETIFRSISMDLSIAGFLERSAVNGPGIRSVLWVQGCPIRCPGCFNKALWSFSRRYVVDHTLISSRILALDGIDGVTFSGGEPFSQAAALAGLGTELRECGLHILTFTGHSYSALASRSLPSWAALLEVTDTLVSGPYLPHLHAQNGPAASSNQEVIDVSGAAGGCRAAPAGLMRTAEITIRPDGEVLTTGYPDEALLKSFSGNDFQDDCDVSF